MTIDRSKIGKRIRKIIISKMKLGDVEEEVTPDKKFFEISEVSYKNFWKMCRGLEGEFKEHKIIIKDSDEDKLLTLNSTIDFIIFKIKKSKGRS